MSNFMGPMAPPPAAPGQPPQLDFQTDPNQRQRFKQFMQQRMQPPMPQMPAPMPMAPMPQPMPYMGNNIDIFAPQPMAFADGGSVSDALADALSNDIGDYAADDTMTDLAQTSWSDFDPGGNESYDAASMDQFRNQQRSDISDIIGQQIQSSITANQRMGTPAPVPQSRIEQMQFENLQNVPTTEPVFSMPSLNLGGKSTSFDLLGNPLTIGFEDGGSVPPRETDIRGMHHELSYITPDEADILMALGGTGEAGPMGIPSYRPGGDDVGSENAGSGDHSGGSGSASGANSGGGRDDNNDPGSEPGDFEANTNTPKGSEPDDPFAGEEGDDFDSGIYGNDDGSFNPSDFRTFNPSYPTDVNPIYQQAIETRKRIDQQAQAQPVTTVTGQQNKAIGDGDIESLDDLTTSLTNAVESSSKTSGPKTNNNLLGSDDLLSLEDYNKMLDHQRNLGLSPYKTPENVGYDKTGMPKGLETVVSPDGQLVTKNLAGLTEEQMKNRPLSLKIAQDIMGSDPYAYEVDPVTNEVIGQIGTPGMGLLGQGINAIQNIIMGPPETFEDLLSRGAYTGMNSPDSSGGNDGGDNVLLPISPEEVAPESTNPNQIGGIGTPGSPIAAGPVLVPSTRTSTPFSGQMPVGYGTPQTGQINPYSLSEMQRYQQMLARLGQAKSPIGLADGGSVLDAAAGRFLESLTTA